MYNTIYLYLITIHREIAEFREVVPELNASTDVKSWENDVKTYNDKGWQEKGENNTTTPRTSHASSSNESLYSDLGSQVCKQLTHMHAQKN